MASRHPNEGREVRLASADQTTRADVLVRLEFPTLSRRQVRELFAAGRVRVNGRVARKGSGVGAGDTLRVELSGAETLARPLPDTAQAIEILFEDPHLVALDKPAGVPTLPLHLGERGTLANFLAARYPDSPLAEGASESGLVHRLDTGTSGVILAARTAEAYRHLRRQFRKREVGKTYLALVHGDLDAPTTIEAAIAHAQSAKRMEAHFMKEGAILAKARPAITVLRPVKRFGLATLVAVRIETGVRHQIRVHLASIQHPIVGDDLYGGNDRVSVSHDALSTNHPLLHARRLRLVHPIDGRMLRIVAPLPADLRQVLARLGGSSPADSSP